MATCIFCDSDATFTDLQQFRTQRVNCVPCGGEYEILNQLLADLPNQQRWAQEKPLAEEAIRWALRVGQPVKLMCTEDIGVLIGKFQNAI
jgi:hypothetical protein